MLCDALVSEDEQPYKVPENWIWVRMGEVVKINPTKPKLNLPPEQLCSFLPMGGVNPKTGSIDKLEEREFQIVKKGYTYFEENDVLFAKITPCMENGNTVIAKGLANKFGFGSTEFHVLRTSKKIDERYIYYLLRTEKFRIQAKMEMTGAVGQQRVSKKYLESYPLALPPLNEQKRIAEKVERLLSKIDEAKQLIEEAKETFELRRAAILDKAFRGQLETNNVNENYSSFQDYNKNNTHELEGPYQLPPNWKWFKISDLFEQVKAHIEPTGIENYIGLEHLNKGGGILEIGSSEGVKSSKVLFNSGDVLYGKLRPYLNKHAYVTFDGVSSTDIIVFRSKSNEKILNQLLNMYLGLPHVVTYANENSSGINLPRVSPKVMGELLFPCPPLSEQEYLVKTVDRLLSKLQSEQELLPSLLENLKSLKESILSKAFRGELGTNDPSEENVIELLKGILREQVK